MNDLLTDRVMARASARGVGVSLASLLLCAGALGACGDEDLAEGPGGDWSPPPLRDPVALSDEELAREALALLGSSAVGAEGSCSNCHSLGRPTLTRWSTLTRAFDAQCLADTSLSDSAAVDAMLDCFSAHAEPATTFVPADFGIYSAAAHLPWFSFVFDHQSGASQARVRHDQFVANVGMPRAGSLLSQSEFDVLAEWFARDLPQLFELVPEDNGEECTAGLDPRLRAHVEEMSRSGWRAKNEQVPLLMLGCGEGEAGADCLTDFPLASEEGLAWDTPTGARIRVLYDNSATPSRFWSRSSPDGRYIASGLVDDGRSDFTGQFVDLARDRVIDAAFSYDPTFFPDNSGFMLQRDGGYSSAAPGGGPTSGDADRGDVAVLCDQSVLADDPFEITGEEAQCIALDSQIGLYQQLAKSIDGEDYWVVYGAYDSDNGGRGPVLENPSAAFGRDSVTTLVPMINQGARFEPGAATRLSTPSEGDPMLSPSGRLMVTRLKGREYSRQVGGGTVVTAEQSGYALHLVETAWDGKESSASLTDVGRICMQGGKAVISYDERWMVFHHYVIDADARDMGFASADDEEFADYRGFGASNLYLVDLTTGAAQPITDMGPGEYALFPHFRSDGWIYFVVRNLDGEEYFAASDAAVLLDGSGGD